MCREVKNIAGLKSIMNQFDILDGAISPQWGYKFIQVPIGLLCYNQETLEHIHMTNRVEISWSKGIAEIIPESVLITVELC